MKRFAIANVAFVMLIGACDGHREDPCAGAGDCSVSNVNVHVDAQAAKPTVSGPGCDGVTVMCNVLGDSDTLCTFAPARVGACKVSLVTATGSTVERDIEIVHVEDCCPRFIAPDVDLRSDAGG